MSKSNLMAFCMALALFCGAALHGAEANEQKASQPAAVEQERQGIANPGLCVARGLSNLCCCWLEIPRCAIYDNSVVPFFGILVGIPEGSLFTVARVGTGLLDVLSFGTTGDSMHGKSFPDFVWQANWLPPSEAKK